MQSVSLEVKQLPHPVWNLDFQIIWFFKAWNCVLWSNSKFACPVCPGRGCVSDNAKVPRWKTLTGLTSAGNKRSANFLAKKFGFLVFWSFLFDFWHFERGCVNAIVYFPKMTSSKCQQTKNRKKPENFTKFGLCRPIFQIKLTGTNLAINANDATSELFYKFCKTGNISIY